MIVNMVESYTEVVYRALTVVEPQPTILITINPKERKLSLFWDPDSWSIIAFQDLGCTSPSTGRLPKMFMYVCIHACAVSCSVLYW